MKSLRIDRAISNTQLPLLEAINTPHFQPGDVLIVSGGFEDRALAVLNLACSQNVEGLSIIGFEYSPPISQNRHEEIIALCEKAHWSYLGLNYDRRNPSGAFDLLSKALPTDAGRVYLDISGMSRLLIAQLVAGLIRHYPARAAVSVLYAEAEHYPPSRHEAEAQIEKNSIDSATLLSFLSNGVFDLTVVPELSSINLHRAPIRLIAFPSLNPAQLLSVRSSIQPTQLTLIHGIPPDPELHWRTDVIVALNKLDQDIPRQDIYVSTLDYSEALKALLELYESWAEFNTLMISPTGSKMQTVAVAIFRAFINDIQVIYPTPLRFTNPEAHTHGVKQLYELNLDSLIDLYRTVQ